MSYQSEQELEDQLLRDLQALGYGLAVLRDEAALWANWQQQFSALNAAVLGAQPLSAGEYEQCWQHLTKGTAFERAQRLRDRYALVRADGQICYVQFLDQQTWDHNRFQVAQQISIQGRYKNRYDVTLLINGLPLAQAELKRRCADIKVSFNQVLRYQRDSYFAGRGFFSLVQLFVISNGVNTKYFAHNRRNKDFKQTFFWTDPKNKRYNRLEDFAQQFLNPLHLWAMLTHYMVLQHTDKQLMVLRPYQYYAANAILRQAQETPDTNGYIWHTTGSGKTLPSPTSPSDQGGLCGGPPRFVCADLGGVQRVCARQCAKHQQDQGLGKPTHRSLPRCQGDASQDASGGHHHPKIAKRHHQKAVPKCDAGPSRSTAGLYL